MNPQQQPPSDPVPFFVFLGIVVTVYLAYRAITDKNHPARAAWVVGGRFGMTVGLSAGLMILAVQAPRLQALPAGSLPRAALQTALGIVSFAIAEMLISHWANKFKRGTSDVVPTAVPSEKSSHAD